MRLLETIKDFFSGPEASFQELLLPDYFSTKRLEFDSIGEYAKWLRGIQAQFGSMAYIKKSQGFSVPEKWLNGLRKIEDEIDKVKNESGPNLFPPADGTKMSDSFK